MNTAAPSPEFPPNGVDRQISIVQKANAMRAVLSQVYEVPVVLDIGAGIQPQSFVTPKVHICVEAHRPYVDLLVAKHQRDYRLVVVNGTWQEVVPRLADKSVDTSFALDLIEHLTPSDGEALLRELERVSRCQVVVFTPVGFYPQTYAEGELDRWGMDGGFWQTHRSGWMPTQFAALGSNWNVIVCPDFHTLDHHDQPLTEPWGAQWAIATLTKPQAAITAWDERERGSGRLSRVPAPIRKPLRALWRALRSVTR